MASDFLFRLPWRDPTSPPDWLDNLIGAAVGNPLQKGAAANAMMFGSPYAGVTQQTPLGAVGGAVDYWTGKKDVATQPVMDQYFISAPSMQREQSQDLGPFAQMLNQMMGNTEAISSYTPSLPAMKPTVTPDYSESKALLFEAMQDPETVRQRFDIPLELEGPPALNNEAIDALFSMMAETAPEKLNEDEMRANSILAFLQGLAGGSSRGLAGAGAAGLQGLLQSEMRNQELTREQELRMDDYLTRAAGLIQNVMGIEQTQAANEVSTRNRNKELAYESKLTGEEMASRAEAQNSELIRLLSDVVARGKEYAANATNQDEANRYRQAADEARMYLDTLQIRGQEQRALATFLGRGMSGPSAQEYFDREQDFISGGPDIGKEAGLALNRFNRAVLRGDEMEAIESVAQLIVSNPGLANSLLGQDPNTLGTSEMLYSKIRDGLLSRLGRGDVSWLETVAQQYPQLQILMTPAEQGGWLRRR